MFTQCLNYILYGKFYMSKYVSTVLNTDESIFGEMNRREEVDCNCKLFICFSLSLLPYLLYTNNFIL